MSELKLSVICPAYNCAAALVKTLEGCRRQTLPSEDYEIILVDDHSDDGLAQRIVPWVSLGGIRYVRNPRRLGPGGTRNRGLALASHPIILLLDGDNLPHPRCFEEHLRAHREHPQAEIGVLGRVIWPEEENLAPLDKLDDVVSNYRLFRDGQFYDGRYFFTANLSLKREFLGNDRFDESLFLERLGFEDTDFGMRLTAKGLRLLYRSEAVSYHYHFRRPDEYLAKVRHYGQTLRRWLAGNTLSPEDRKYISQKYLPWQRPVISPAFAKYLLQSLLVNDWTAPVWRTLARAAENRFETLSVLLYKRLHAYFFIKGYREG